MKKLLSFFYIVYVPLALCAQTLPVGTPVLEDYYRREQLLGRVDSNISFMVRPLTSEALKRDDIFRDVADTRDEQVENAGKISYGQKSFEFKVLPVTWIQQYNTKRPYGWNDGAMIPARGYQTLVSGGVYIKYGGLRVQLNPEIVYACNEPYKKFPDDFAFDYEPLIDLPYSFGPKSYVNILPGQSSISMTFGPVAASISSENIWWGPGVYNSLLMSNTAAGFNHISFNTSKPIGTPIGFFESQLLLGRLDGSKGANKPQDWRLFSGILVTYQPRWVRGLFLGFGRSFMAYSKTLKNVMDYFPVFQSVNQFHNRASAVSRDQLFSLFGRWLWTDAKTEMYFEFGREDYSGTTRDFILEPEHSRAYLFGINKILPLSTRSSYICLNLEVTHLQQPLNYFVRTAGSWYSHSPILHGYTSRGQLLGAGIGPGSNCNTLSLSWINGLSKFGVKIEKVKHTNDYFAPSYPDNFQEYQTEFNWGIDSNIRINHLLIGLSTMKISDTFFGTDLLNKHDKNFHLTSAINYWF